MRDEFSQSSIVIGVTSTVIIESILIGLKSISIFSDDFNFDPNQADAIENINNFNWNTIDYVTKIKETSTINYCMDTLGILKPIFRV